MLTTETFERVPRDRVERALRALDGALGLSKLVTDPEKLLLDFGGDESENAAVRPDVAVLAESAEDVRAVLGIADACDVPVVPRAAGSGKSGGAIPVAGGIVLMTLGMNRIVDIDREEQIAVVEPGVVLGDLHRVVEAEGLFYPPDANSLGVCAIGGNVAENAGGPRAFKYGSTRNWILGLDVATIGGASFFCGRRTKKGVTGYDVTSLLVGSEGTLAVTERAVLALTRKPDVVRTLLALFTDARTAGRAVTGLLARATPRCIEFLDESTLDAVRARGVAVDPGAGAMLILEVEGSAATCDEDMEAVGGACVEAGALDVLVAKDEAQRDKLWEARRSLSHVTRAMAKHKVSEDVVVPRRHIPALLDETRRIQEVTGVRTLTYGHAGDGNLHVNFLWDDPSRVDAVNRGLRMLFEAVVGFGGTLTGEHGVGLSKKAFLSLEQSPALVAVQRELKRAFDPKGLLNPHKIFTGTGHAAC